MDIVDAYLDAAAAAVGLPIAAEHRSGVAQYLQLAAGFAERVLDFPLDASVEAAAVFVPVEVPQ
ncbi:MAG: DUF4089 domain-containing protein [Rubrivivax sp.]|nr:DUF4089 domain-containing protein [Rubrivivax sp.]